jgi:hypothetical protein
MRRMSLAAKWTLATGTIRNKITSIEEAKPQYRKGDPSLPCCVQSPIQLNTLTESEGLKPMPRVIDPDLTIRQ